MVRVSDVDNLKLSYAITWEQRKLSGLANETNGGGTPKTSVDSYWNGNIPWIQSSDIKGTAIKGITKEELLNKNILLPELAEQDLIGKYFQQLDNLITLHQRKLLNLV